jgi:ankyrin repeat protein
MAAAEPTAAQPKKAGTTKVAPRKTTTQPRPVAKSSAPVAFQPKTSSGLKYNDLVTAVLYRDAEAVSQLIKLGRWADKPDSRGTTPLMLAVEQGDARTAQVLLKAGAEPSRAVRVAQDRGDAAMVDLLKRYAPR